MCFWCTNNFATQQVIRYGNDKSHIHILGLNFFNLTLHHIIDLKVFYVRREYNKQVDRTSKTIDFDDWCMTQHLALSTEAEDIKPLFFRLVKRGKSSFTINISHTKNQKQFLSALTGLQILFGLC